MNNGCHNNGSPSSIYDITHFNNFLEFTDDQQAVAAKSKDFRTDGCGTCRIQLIRGQVDMELDAALSAEDKAANIILACQAKCLSDVAVRRLRIV